MKKTSVFLIGIACCLQLAAQNNKVTSAVMHLTDYGSHQDTTELSDARAAIDEAALNEKTKDEPKMYLYRGEVYLAWFNLHLQSIESKDVASGMNADKALRDGFSKIDTSSICIAANSFMQVIQLVPKDYYAQEAEDKANLPICFVDLENKAQVEFNEKHYAIALPLYKKILSVCPYLKISDTSNNYKANLEMVAFSYDKTGNNAQALVNYQKMIDLKYDGSLPYRLVSALYLKQNDSAKAWDIIEKGRTQFPDDEQLIILETNYFIARHNYEKAETNLKLSISKVEAKSIKDTNQLSSLYVNLGQIYDHRANPRDDKNTDLPKPVDFDDLFSKAETNYIKALDYTPHNFDVLFVTGALYYNRGVNIEKDADKLPLNATEKYNKLKADAKSYFLKAQPYFERAHAINPSDASNTAALRQVYASTDQNEKADALGK